ncbi:MAG: cell division protein ZapA [Gammaproteobacteria bacterium]|nr:cell division protein ZapA [Gammaproteobacteria bacterium]
MSANPQPVTVTIFDKDYIVGCTEEERESLMKAVTYLNRKMQELRDKGKVIGTERIAVMSALNITHEFLEYKRSNEEFASVVGSGIERIQAKISHALTRGQQLKSTDLTEHT